MRRPYRSVKARRSCSPNLPSS
uniref:Uncharacterized protein n=1 Tax=Arundo donax TaxID=35708 RepID=A0A0A9C876_ARUDO